MCCKYSHNVGMITPKKIITEKSRLKIVVIYIYICDSIFSLCEPQIDWSTSGHMTCNKQTLWPAQVSKQATMALICDLKTSNLCSLAINSVWTGTWCGTWCGNSVKLWKSSYYPSLKFVEFPDHISIDYGLIDYTVSSCFTFKRFQYNTYDRKYST